MLDKMACSPQPPDTISLKSVSNVTNMRLGMHNVQLHTSFYEQTQTWKFTQ